MLVLLLFSAPRRLMSEFSHNWRIFSSVCEYDWLTCYPAAYLLSNSHKKNTAKALVFRLVNREHKAFSLYSTLRILLVRNTLSLYIWSALTNLFSNIYCKNCFFKCRQFCTSSRKFSLSCSKFRKSATAQTKLSLVSRKSICYCIAARVWITKKRSPARVKLSTLSESKALC